MIKVEVKNLYKVFSELEIGLIGYLTFTITHIFIRGLNRRKMMSPSKIGFC